MLKNKLTDVSLPPESVLTLWGTWIDAGLFYADHFDDVTLSIDCSISSYNMLIQQSKRIFNSEFLQTDQAVHETYFKTIPQSKKKLEISVCSVSQILDVIKKLAVMKFVHTEFAHNVHKNFASFCKEI
jgi:hypothetical protein